MFRELRLPIALWALGSCALVVWSLQVEAAVIVAGVYVALNGASLVLTMFRTPSVPATAMKVMAWCTAAQLPTMLVLLFDPSGTRRSVDPSMQPVVEAERGKLNHRLPSRTMRPSKGTKPEMPREVERDPG